jgi:hypothetical protein
MKSVVFYAFVFIGILFVLQLAFPVRELFLSPTPCLNSNEILCNGMCVSDCPNGQYPTGVCRPPK